MDVGRVGLGCLRIPPDDDATIRAAWDAGVRLFDTARAYPGSEEQLARTLDAEANAGAFVVTKCGMKRPDGPGHRTDARTRSSTTRGRATPRWEACPISYSCMRPIRACRFATSVRALARATRAKGEGLARAIGLSNVGRKQLDEATAIAPIAAVEVAFGAFDDEAARGGIVTWCAANGAQLRAHSPLGGPKRAPRVANDPALRVVARRHDVALAVVVVAYLLAVHPAIFPLVGASRPDSIRPALRSAGLTLAEEDLAILDARFPSFAAIRRPPPRAAVDPSRDVVVLMGIAGAGKSRLAESYVARGYERLNRDTLGGTLRGIAKRLDERLAGGAARIVLDNTYVTRAARADVVRLASSRGAAFCAIETIPFARQEPFGLRPGVAIPFERRERTDVLASVPKETPVLVFAWRPPAGAADVVEELAMRSGRVIRREGSFIVASSPVHRQLAATVGVRTLDVG